ncbi:MAG: TSUP family transporter [Clostridiaceae bacterium]|jgi:uncharacterized membrane protein YfcA|nr:TSUP family transporter [Clostridiaceae bacterium]
MEFNLRTLLIVCPMVFLSGFVDSVAGGGGLISIPAYVFAGLPMINAYGTNKFSAALGTCVSSFKYFKSGNIHLPTGAASAAGALIGAWMGSQLAMVMEDQVLRYCLMVILPVAGGFILFNRKFGENEDFHERVKALYPKAFVIGLALGAYDGFFGPGTGTFLMILFCVVLGLPLVTSSGNAKVTNLASNIASAAAYLIGGKVIFWLAIPAACCTIAGNYIGAHLAIKNGAKFIKPLIVVVIVLLMLKIVTEMFG